MIMDFTIYSVINEFFNIENHIEIWTYILPFVTWPTFKSITFYNVFRFILSFLKRVMLKIQKIIIWWFLPYISVLFISQKEKKLKTVKIASPYTVEKQQQKSIPRFLIIGGIILVVVIIIYVVVLLLTKEDEEKGGTIIMEGVDYHEFA